MCVSWCTSWNRRNKRPNQLVYMIQCRFRLMMGDQLAAVMKPEGSLLQLVAVQGQLNPAILIHYFFNMLFNIILTSSDTSPKLSRADFRLIFVGIRGKQIPGARSLWRLNPTVAFNICGPTVWNLVRVAQSVAPVILRWLLDFWKTCAPLMCMSFPSRVLHETPTSRAFIYPL